MNGIPFQLPDIGLREIRGTIALDDEFLVFHVEASLIGEFDKEQFTVNIEPAALADIRLKRGIVRDRIRVRPKARDLLAAIPGEHVEELQLKVWVTRRADAERLVHAVRRQKQATRAEHPVRRIHWTDTRSSVESGWSSVPRWPQTGTNDPCGSDCWICWICWTVGSLQLLLIALSTPVHWSYDVDSSFSRIPGCGRRTRIRRLHRRRQRPARPSSRARPSAVRG